MTGAKHTPGPWEISIVGDDVRIYSEDDGCVADLSPDFDNLEDKDEIEANAKLIHAAPDHALLLATVVALDAVWIPFTPPDGRGELAFDGLRYSTKLDDFGCPILTDGLRAALAKAGRR